MEENPKKIIFLAIVATLIFLAIVVFTTKGNNENYFESTSIEESSSEIQNNALEKILTDSLEDYEELNLDYSWDESDVYEIILNGDEIITNTNLEVKGNILYIKNGGDYLISGNLDEGQIIVYSEDSNSVRLILNGVDISSSNGAPISILNAEETIITLAEGSINYLTDTSTYSNSSTDADATTAAIYSKDDLYINGFGTLVINSENQNGIQSKDQLVILNGKFEINAAKESLKAKDYIIIENGNFNLTAGEDGIRVTEEEDSEKGHIIILDGTITIESVRDGIQAETYLLIKNGVLDITTTSQINSESSKGLKAENYIEINNAQITINSKDDSINSDSVIINSGKIIASSNDDGIHAENELQINGGEISIEKSIEGIEGNNIYINGGKILVVSSDDGINIADESGESMRAISGAALYINGGELYVNSNGDGLDSNGNIYITGGTIIVNGPINNGNGALDCNGELIITGGYLIAVGSAGMAETPDQSSNQNSISIIFSETMQAGTEIKIKSENGNEIFSLTSEKIFMSFVASSDEIKIGESYSIYINGEFYQEFTVTNVVTQIGNSAGQNFGMQNPNGNNMGGRGFR